MIVHVVCELVEAFFFLFEGFFEFLDDSFVMRCFLRGGYDLDSIGVADVSNFVFDLDDFAILSAEEGL